MSRYERAYGDWDELDQDEAVERAYALGVAAALDEYHRDELEAVRAEMSTAYDKSIVELAFEEGRNEGKEAESESDTGEEEAVWSELVAGEVPVEPDESPTGGRDGLPEAIDVPDAIERADRDSTDALDLPEFLEKE
jgi:hypothetical protein